MIDTYGGIGVPHAASDAEPAIAVENVTKIYIGGDGQPLKVLDGLDLDVAAGETIAIIGQSGAGKSTLLHIVGGLDRPSSGRVRVGGTSLVDLPEEKLARFRSERIGFVFQFHHLLREFTALENVMMPQLVLGVSRSAARDRARELLGQVGLESRMEHKPSQLSGGEQQRVAVARALANRPVVLLADEPSGNLDPHTSDRLHDLLFSVSSEHASSIILVTHNLDLAARADRILRVAEGQLVPMLAEPTGFEADRHSGA